MKKRVLILVLIVLLGAWSIGRVHSAIEISIQPPPDKPLPAPIAAQESNPFPRPTEIFISSQAMGEYVWYYRNGTKPELVEKTHPTAIGLCGEAVFGTEPYFCEDCFRFNMEIFHAWGIKNISQIAGMHADLDANDPQRQVLLKASCINIEGETMRGGIFQCTNNPAWREYLLEVAKRSITLGEGADGIYIDECQGIRMTPDGGCFCDYCMQGFREYLKTKYNTEELIAFGIENIDSFHYGDFIRANYLTLYKDRRWEVPLYWDFYGYMMESTIQFWHQFIIEVKAFAINQGKKVPFSANTISCGAIIYP
jgi:hypothetical protein